MEIIPNLKLRFLYADLLRDHTPMQYYTAWLKSDEMWRVYNDRMRGIISYLPCPLKAEPCSKTCLADQNS